MNVEDKLQEMSKRHIDGRMAHQIVRFSELNPEQKLAYMLEVLVTHSKATLSLYGVSMALAESCKVWKDTPEGKAWQEKQKAKRAAKAASTDAK